MPERKSTGIGTVGADTTFLIDFFKGVPEAVGFMRANARHLRVSELVVYEFLCGNLSPDQQKRFFDAMQSFPSLGFGREAAVIAGRLYRNAWEKGLVVGHQDSMIAGSYLSGGVQMIVTRNVKHFSSLEEIETISY